MKLFILTILITFSQLSFASFKASGECNYCSATQAENKARLYQRDNQEGTVYIFDFGSNKLNKYRVKSFLNPRSGRQTTIINPLTPLSHELNLFNDMLTFNKRIVEVSVPPSSGYSSGFEMSGCRSCQTDIGLWITNNHTLTMMFHETLNQATSVFDFINWDYEYTVVITFSDGVTMELEMVNDEFKMVEGSLRDSNYNEIPDSRGDVSGSSYTFPRNTPVGSSMVQNLLDRIRDFGWDLGSGGSYICTYQCTPTRCTLSCSGN